MALLLVSANVIGSSSWVEARVAARVKQATGRDFAVNGSTRLFFQPTPHIEITDATVPDPAPGAAEFSVAKLEIHFGLSDLFSLGHSAERVVLEQPVLTVHLGEQRQASLGDEPVPGLKPARFEPLRFAKAQVASAINTVRDVRIDDLQIKNGTILLQYADYPVDKRIKHINANVKLPSLSAPLVSKGTFYWKKESVSFNAALTTPAALRAQRTAKLEVALDAKGGAAHFDGTIATAPYFAGEGKIAAKVRSIPELAGWLSGTSSSAPAVGVGEVNSAIAWSNQEIELSETRFALEHARGEGKATVALKRPRPHVEGVFTFAHLDLNPFFDSDARGLRRSSHAVQRGYSATASGTSKGIDWFSAPAPSAAEVEQAIVPPPPLAKMDSSDRAALRLLKPGPGVSQPSLAIAMPQAAIDRVLAQDPMNIKRAGPAALSASFDANVNLSLRSTRFGHLDLGPSALGLAFTDGRLEATLWDMSLYGGEARGKLTADFTKPVPTFQGELHVDDVDARPFLTDAAQFNLIDGRTRVTLTVSGEGQDADEITSSLSGNGAFVVTDGALEGLDITAMIRGLGEGRWDLQQGASATTQFKTLAASFNLNEGVATTNNLRLRSPLLKVDASGTVDLHREFLDLLATPEIVAGDEGRSGPNALDGLSVPLRIEGPMARPRIRPEISAVLADSENAGSAVSKIGAMLRKKFGGRPVGEMIGRLLGGSATAGADGGNVQPQALGPALSVSPQDGDTAVEPMTEDRLR